MSLEIIASLAATLAQWLQIRKQRREAGSQKTIADYNEWLRRQEHADLASHLEENRDLLMHVKQLIEDQSLDSIDSQQQLQQTIEQRLTVISGGVVGQILGPVTINVQSPPREAPPEAPPTPVTADPAAPAHRNVKVDCDVFISYSHRDETWKDRLLPQLRALEQAGKLTVWDDRKIDAGATWYPEIEHAMNRATVAVLLISPDYLASQFCVKEEVPHLLKRRRAEGLVVIPVLIRPCVFEAIDWLSPIQMLPRDGKAVAADYADNYDVVFADVARRVLAAVSALAPMRADVKTADAVAAEAPAEETPPQWPPLPDDAVDITRLPVTGAELFGRQSELKRLDEAWETDESNVLSFVAWGGVGKSTLVNRWLDRLGADNFRGAQRVFGWSFYSQGAGQRVTSAERFVNFALRWFGDEDPDAGSPWAKGDRLARLIAQRRTLLILDGMEPLQASRDFERGHIKDPALQMLVRALAKYNPGLCVITTREPVADLKQSRTGAVEHDLEQISTQAARSLLRVKGVRGTDAELEAAAQSFGCHALAINLLASYLHDIPDHPIAAAAQIPDLNIPEEKGRHARRVISAFETRFGDGAETDTLRIIGLFDRPATRPEIDAIVTDPPIANLTSNLHEQSPLARAAVVEKLRDIGLIAKKSSHAQDELDAHPLVREHFGEALRKRHAKAWQAGHNRLYEYLKGPGCAKDLPDTLAEMQPLFAAVTHGCAAGCHQEAYYDVYLRRIARGAEAYAVHKLGAFGADLGALAGFFEELWRRPVKTLSAPARSFIVGRAGFRLRALGRLRDAVAPLKAALNAATEAEDWTSAARRAVNLSELLLTLGKVEQATRYATQSVDYADRNDDAFLRMAVRTALADALHQAWRAEEAEDLFQEAERMQIEDQPEYPLLYSVQGFQYCDLLLGRGAYEDVIKRATQTLEWAEAQKFLLDIALDHLSLGRAHLLKARAEGGDTCGQAWAHLDTAVDKLREAGMQDHLPRGLLTRAELYIFTGSFDAARADLNEALDIATRDPQGRMKLFITDYHLLSARLELAQADAEADAAKASAARA
ncbi:MAG: TIR domain-containing protein, partial [Phycisphaerae bacterium]|nr:TIR domain-containing protein [Phycisphaerae bacterium]